MRHGLLGRQSFLMVVSEQLGYKVDGLVRHQMLVLRRDEFLPGLLGVAAEDAIEVRIEFQVVGVEVVEEFLRAQDLCDLDELIVVVMAVEEGFLSEDHSCEHASETPHVEGVVVLLQIDKEFRSLEVAGGDAHVVLASWVVEFGKSPVDQPQLTLLVVNHDVVRLDVSVHDTVRMAIIERLEEFEDVVSDVVVGEGGVEDFEVCVVDMFEDEGRRLRLRITDDIEELNDIGAAAHVL
mmetsp:Transcript_2371/g.6553  ORF Transcript_2371/g.6553 Transcript_2371/m.6553 type:complete len:237 (+) Transcript_2371:263-973(+)